MKNKINEFLHDSKNEFAEEFMWCIYFNTVVHTCTVQVRCA